MVWWVWCLSSGPGPESNLWDLSGTRRDLVVHWTPHVFHGWCVYIHVCATMPGNFFFSFINTSICFPCYKNDRASIQKDGLINPTPKPEWKPCLDNISDTVRGPHLCYTWPTESVFNLDSMYKTPAFLCVSNTTNMQYTHMSLESICGKTNQVSHLRYSFPSFDIILVCRKMQTGIHLHIEWNKGL